MADSTANGPAELTVPLADGSAWPGVAGRTGFAAQLLFHNGQRSAFEAPAHRVGDLISAEILPQLALDTTDEDKPYLHQTLVAAGQLGAGIASQEENASALVISADGAAALQLALISLPRLEPELRPIALFVVHCGYYLARCGETGLQTIREANHWPS